MARKIFNYKNEKGEIEEVELRRWAWGVLYKDGKELHQFDSEGNFHRLSEIDQDKVGLFVVYKPEDMSKRIDIVLPEKARIIFLYRNIKPYYKDNFVRVYMFGYRTGKKEKDFKYHYNFILPDDRIIQSTEDNIDLTKFDI